MRHRPPFPLSSARPLAWLLWMLLSVALGACAHSRPDEERIVETATGRVLTRSELLSMLRASDFALLGELHDNPLHHRRRGELISALGASTTVVAEQLTRGQRVAPQGDLLEALRAAGFDARAWEWPLHEPLFSAVRSTGTPIAGGNLEPDRAKRIAREGEPAWPQDIASLLRRSPLSPPARAALDADLLAGHCGRLPEARVPGMRSAQQARDAALAIALDETAGRPAVLVAGNGHVRTDYGVPRLLATLRPGARVVSVAFLEHGAAPTPADGDYAWITPSTPREDPCGSG